MISRAFRVNDVQVVDAQTINIRANTLWVESIYNWLNDSVYHCNTETYIIKSIPQPDQETEMRSWLREMADMYGRDEDTLYIVLYSGSSAWCNGKVHLS